MKQQKNALFSTRWGFILSAVGSAVGMANVWGFPAKMGANGGGAFLVAYLIFVALFSVVGLSAEYAIGRRSRTGTLGSYRAAWATRNEKLGKAGGLLGWLPLNLGMRIVLSICAAFFGICTFVSHCMRHKHDYGSIFILYKKRTYESKGESSIFELVILSLQLVIAYHYWHI